jgi:alpha-L-arabinofuranosidase
MNRTFRTIFVIVILLGLAAPASGPAQAAVSNNMVINPNQIITTVSPLMLGSNAPSWLGNGYSNAAFRARTKFSGLKYLRIPGGSWSNSYGWLNCEKRTYNTSLGYSCGGSDDWSSWITRPTDFINFLRATNQQAIYIINVNATAQEAAALVAFFNSTPADATVIGMDINGEDWGTAGQWAQLRVNHGNAAPFYIKYWEFGNEVYGATQATGGAGCDPWGWENAWTCDGAEYINGNANHDGYKQIRTAMQAVDPSILLGAVGIEAPTDYSNWGVKVLQQAGSIMDSYVVHPYTFGTPPANTAAGWTQILAKPRQTWPAIKSTLQAAFNQYAGGRNIPIAATEFNLVYSHDLDTQKMMRTAGNMLFISESIGQAISNGYIMFDQWSLANGCSSVTNSCYDLLLADNNYARTPQYFAFPLWSRFGGTMLKLTSNVPTARLSAYAGKVNATTYSLLVINKTGQSVTSKVNFSDGRTVLSGTVDVASAASLNATSVTFNGKTSIANNFSNAPSLTLNVVAGKVTYTFPPYSVTLLKMKMP